MSESRLRQAVALEAARLVYDRAEPDFQAAKKKASLRVSIGRQVIESHEAAGGHPCLLSPYVVFRMLLLPLEKVRGNPQLHPEGDYLYHSLQVFELARQSQPYDYELVQAALLHDVGKALDPADSVGAALEVLEGLLTPRAAFFIRHLPDAQLLRKGQLGHKTRLRLEASPDFEDLLNLEEWDAAGRQRGAPVPTVDEALAALKELEIFEEDGPPEP
jgi:hypothetical protein